MLSWKLSLARSMALFFTAWFGTLSLAPASAAPRAASSAPAQDAQALTDYVTHFLKTQTDAQTHGALQIHIEPPRTKGLASCDTLQAVMPKTLRTRMSIQVRCLTPQTWSLYVQANLALPGVYYTAARTVAPGDIVTRDDLREAQTDLLRLPQDTILDPVQAIGHIATQRIRKGSTIKSGALRAPESIHRGQRVHIEARGPGFVMRSIGQALQGGAPGSQIQVRTTSGSVISGIVIDAATVQAPL